MSSVLLSKKGGWVRGWGGGGGGRGATFMRFLNTALRVASNLGTPAHVVIVISIFMLLFVPEPDGHPYYSECNGQTEYSVSS